jgi:hypothetical protein
MRRILVIAACWAGLASAAAAADVGVSIQFSQPGVFGRVDIGQFPQPQVIVAKPIVVAPPPVGLPPPEPVYLWVPIEHRKHWDRYCGEYHACGHPVYFVNHVWYRNNVVAHQGRGEGRHEEERGREHGRGGDEREGHRGRDEEEHDRGRGRN